MTQEHNQWLPTRDTAKKFAYLAVAATAFVYGPALAATAARTVTPMLFNAVYGASVFNSLFSYPVAEQVGASVYVVTRELVTPAFFACAASLLSSSANDDKSTSGQTTDAYATTAAARQYADI